MSLATSTTISPTYRKQSPLFQDGANDGFHEAIGDTVALSVTPEYLHKLGLINEVPDASKDIGVLMDRALQKVAFLPFAYLVDQWRWKVYAGQVKPADYDKVWWELREKYQGVKRPAPAQRTASMLARSIMSLPIRRTHATS